MSDDGRPDPPSLEPVPASAFMGKTVSLLLASRPVVHAQASQHSTDELNATKAMRSLSQSSTLSDEQKAELLVYFCDHPLAAASVPDDASFREDFFQDLLSQLATE